MARLDLEAEVLKEGCSVGRGSVDKESMDLVVQTLCVT